MGDGGIEFYDSTYAWVNNNYSTQQGVSPYYIVRSESINLHHNTIDLVGGWVFDIVQGSKNIEIWANTVSNYGHGAVVIACGSTDITVLNNDFLGFYPGLWRPAGAGPGVNIDTSTTQNISVNISGNHTVGGSEVTYVNLGTVCN